LSAKLNAKAVRLIDGKNFAFLATIMPDGAPHVAPVWIDREGDTINKAYLSHSKVRRMAQETFSSSIDHKTK